jgi:rubrerythrin
MEEPMPDMTLIEAIQTAVAIEENAADFYDRLSRHTHFRAAKEFFSDMSAQESEHARIFRAMGERFGPGHRQATIEQTMISIESAPQWAWSENLDYDQALAVALEAENNAAFFYDVLSDASPNEELRKFFKSMHSMEMAHAQALEDLKKNS